MNDDVLLKLLQWSGHNVKYHSTEFVGGPSIYSSYVDEFTYQGLKIQYYYDKEEGEHVETSFILTDLGTGKKYTVPGDAEVLGDRICYQGPYVDGLVVERAAYNTGRI